MLCPTKSLEPNLHLECSRRLLWVTARHVPTTAIWAHPAVTVLFPSTKWNMSYGKILARVIPVLSHIVPCVMSSPILHLSMFSIKTYVFVASTAMFVVFQPNMDSAYALIISTRRNGRLVTQYSVPDGFKLNHGQGEWGQLFRLVSSWRMGYSHSTLPI